MIHKNLPHINIKNSYQFITFRTYDSLDDYLAKLYTLETDNKTKQYQIDNYLDNANVGAYLFGENINIVKDVLFEKNQDYYELEAFVIMPNHIHILLKQIADLVKIIKYIKGKSAVLLNKKLNRDGKFWARDYFDKAIRDEKHFEVVYKYIANNPHRANLADSDDRVYLKYKVFW